jgi:hypothetical protein
MAEEKQEQKQQKEQKEAKPEQQHESVEHWIETSSDSRFSTVEPNPDLPDENPPLGSHVVETRGEPNDYTIGSGAKGIAD